MSLSKFFTILIIGSTSICCYSQTNKTTQNEKSRHLISNNGVLGLFIGDSMPEKLKNYSLTKSSKTVEERIQEPIIILAENNVQLLHIGFEYDYDKRIYTNEIGEIVIIDKRFKTENNIGIESTITDFISAYPNFRIWYTYISGMYVIQSKDMKVQFLLDKNGYIGKKDLFSGDSVVLNKEDFLPITRIIKIRIS